MSFKSYLNEYTKHNITRLISKGALPLDPSMMDRLGFSEDLEAYHLTNKIHLDDLYKNQNKHKQLSCFTVGGAELARIPSQPDVLLRLKGTAVISGQTDIWTLVSTRDRRWIDNADRTKGNKLYFRIQGVLSKIAKNYGFLGDVYSMQPEDIQKEIDALDRKAQVSLYRDYLKGIENMLDSGGYKDLISYLKNAADMSYNEVILTKWAIQDVSCVRTEQDSVVEFCTKNKINYGGVVDYKYIIRIGK